MLRRASGVLQATATLSDNFQLPDTFDAGHAALANQCFSCFSCFFAVFLPMKLPGGLSCRVGLKQCGHCQVNSGVALKWPVFMIRFGCQAGVPLAFNRHTPTHTGSW